MKVLMSGAERTEPGPSSGAFARLGDERLARLVATGHERAFCALYERYHQRLYRHCRSIVRDKADAQDALQSTFAAALVALRRGQRSAPVRPWLFRIAHNESISLLRRRPDAVELAEEDGRPAGSAHEELERRDRFEQLVRDLGELPERMRGALLMRELSGLSHEEIAVALDTSVGAAKQAVFDARKGLQELAEGRAMACLEIQRQLSDGDGRVLRARRVRAHLRACPACAAFAAAIPDRRAALGAFVPALGPAGAAAILTRVLGRAPGQAGLGASATASATTVKLVGGSVAGKVLAGAAIAVVAAGAATVSSVSRSAKPPARVTAHTSTTRAGGSSRSPAGRPRPSASSAARPRATTAGRPARASHQPAPAPRRTPGPRHPVAPHGSGHGTAAAASRHPATATSGPATPAAPSGAHASSSTSGRQARSPRGAGWAQRSTGAGHRRGSAPGRAAGHGSSQGRGSSHGHGSSQGHGSSPSHGSGGSAHGGGGTESHGVPHPASPAAASQEGAHGSSGRSPEQGSRR